MAASTIGARHLSRLEYERLAEAGYFQPGERAELVDGVVYAMTPQKSRHVTGVQLTAEALRALAPVGTSLRIQMPLALTDDSEPEPDVALVPGTFRDYRDAHPTTALLVVEVADSSLFHDRRRKAPLYARAAIPDLWLLDLVHGRLEVFRDPVGGKYSTHLVLGPGDAVSPLWRPESRIAVADLLP